MKMYTIRFPKLETEAIHLIFPRVEIKTIPTPAVVTVNVGIPLFDILARNFGIAPCLAIAKSPLELPRIDVITTDAVAKSADIDTNLIM